MTREEFDLVLAEKRTILLDGDIDEEMAAAVKFWLLSFNAKSSERINILIDTNGGSVQPALSMYDLITISSAPVTGIVIGDCQSMGVILLQACHVRMATPHSNFYLHNMIWKNPSLSVDDDFIKTINKKYKELKCLRYKLINIIRKRCGLKIEEIKKLMNDGESYGTHFFADEALKLGLIDKIAKKSPFSE